jgi:RNA polymerase sporulation-specific sigma factor
MVRCNKNGRSGRDAVSVLISRYLKLVLKRAHSFSDDYSDVEDLTQEGLLALYKAIDSFDPENGAKFSSFADVCVSNRIKTVAAGYAKHKENITDDEDAEYALPEVSPESIWLEQERSSSINEEIRSVLAPTEIKVFELYLDGLPYKEIAQKLGMSEKSVDNAVFRIRKKLKALLSRENGEKQGF